MSKKIYLSPSCQINNIYASGNTNEQEQCNRIAEFAKTALERWDFEVKKAPIGTLVIIYSNATENKKAGSADVALTAATLAYDNIISLYFSVKPEYRG